MSSLQNQIQQDGAPQYLQQPNGNEKFGKIRYENGYYYIYDAVPVVHELAKRVLPGCDFPGGRWSRQLRFRATRRLIGDLNWLMLRYPLEIEHPDQYQKDLDAAIEHAHRRQENQTIQAATPPPTFTGELRPFQAEGVSYLIANQRTLLADDMGLGKTVIALATLATADTFPALIIVPATIRRQWRSQAGAFLNLQNGQLFRDETGHSMAHIIEGLTPYDLPDRKLYIIHYGLLRGWADELLSMNFRAVIFDEIQELRHTGTKKYSAASRLAGEASMVFGLSGTPFYNYGSEMWSISNIIDFHCLGDFDSFSREWCTGYGEKIVEKPDVLHDHLKREGLMLRRRKKDVQDQLPPKRRVVQAIDHDEGMYGKLIREASRLAQKYDSITGWHERGKAALEIDKESRRATGVSKAPHVAEFVQSLLHAGEKPLVYAWHHDVHDEIVFRVESAGYAVRMITGKQTGAAKDLSVHEFKEGQADMVQLSLRATAGLDELQGAATCVVFAELDWSPAVHSQCEDRLHRMGIGELDSVLCYYLVSQTGYDGVVMDALGLKIGQFVGVMGDEAETEDDRAMAQRDAKEHLNKVIARLKGEQAH